MTKTLPLILLLVPSILISCAAQKRAMQGPSASQPAGQAATSRPASHVERIASAPVLMEDPATPAPSKEDVAEILRRAHQRAPRGRDIWFILVRDWQPDNFAIVFYEPASHSPRLRKGQWTEFDLPVDPNKASETSKNARRLAQQLDETGRRKSPSAAAGEGHSRSTSRYRPPRSRLGANWRSLPQSGYGQYSGMLPSARV